MKLTNSHNMNRKSGMTLIELTVVILVLLSLIAILFVGATAWKKGSDRAACILNQRNVQQAVRGHQNMANKTTADAIDWTAIIGTDGYIQTTPTCPGGGAYTGKAVNYPAINDLAYPCTLAGTGAGKLQHEPNSSSGW